MSGPLLTHFAHFGSKSFTSKKSGCHAHHHHTTDFAEFQKKIMSQFLENFWMEGQTDLN